MTVLTVVGILGLSGGVFGYLLLQAAGCQPTIGDTLATLVTLNCPF